VVEMVTQLTVPFDFLLIDSIIMLSYLLYELSFLESVSFLRTLKE